MWIKSRASIWLMTTFNKNLGKALKKIRGETTQIEFARKLGIAQSSLNRMEQGEQNVSLKTLDKLCKRLKMTPDELLL